MNYKQARADFEALELIHELDDQMELDAQRIELMQNPTKMRAAEMYASGIGLWFKEHGRKAPNPGCEETIAKIARRWKALQPKD